MRIVLLVDMNKRVYNHAPGPCRYIPNIENGAAGLELTSNGIFMSLGSVYPLTSSVTPQIGLFSLKDNMNYLWDNIKIEGTTFNKEHFSPRHLSSFESKGRLSLYIVNAYPEHEGIEFFSFIKEKKTLLHRRSLNDTRLRSVTSVVAVEPDRLFLTNLAYFSHPIFKTIELLMQSNFGSLLLFDGKAIQVLDAKIPSPSSLAYDKKKKLLYVGSLLNEMVRVYKVNKDLSVKLLHEISLLSSPSGLFIEETTGDLWIALHPVLYQATVYMRDPTAISPSQILRVRMQEGGKSWVITEPYANDGASVAGGSSLIFHQDRLLIGGLYGKALLCDTNKDQIT